MIRRTPVALLLALALLLTSSTVWSGSYLNRAALLLASARAERQMVLPRSDDRELVRMVHSVAKARAEAARHMEVPKEVANAHPHLLMVMENCERAYAAALDREPQKFVEHIMRARAEDKTFRAFIDKMGYTIPRTK